MSNVRHLIENIVLGMKRGENPWEIVEYKHNADMLEETGITAEELVEIADEVVFGLYDGKYPTSRDDKQTNSDLIRNMDDHELANFFTPHDTFFCPEAQSEEGLLACRYRGNWSCSECFFLWLKEEVE